MEKKSNREWNKKLLISVKEAARLLDIAPQSIYNSVSKGKFPIKPKRVGRLVKFRLADIEGYVEAL